MNYMVILLVIFIFTVQMLCFKEFSTKFMRNLASYFFFNFLYFTMVVLIFLVLMNGFEGFHPMTIALGVSFGATFVVAVFCYLKAMETGPLSYSTLIYSFGILVPVIVSAIFWGESVNVVQCAGLILLLITFYLGNEPTEDSKSNINLGWIIFCVAAFIGNGVLMVLGKWHQILLPGKQVVEFLIISFGTAAVLSIILFLLYRNIKNETVSHLKDRIFGIVVLGAGISTAFGNQLSLYLNTKVPSIIQFPSVSGGLVITSAVLSVILFKEKLTARGVAGLALGIVSLVLLSVK